MWQQGTVETYAKVFQNGTTASEKWVDDDGGRIHPPPTLRLEVGVFCYVWINTWSRKLTPLKRRNEDE